MLDPPPTGSTEIRVKAGGSDRLPRRGEPGDIAGRGRDADRDTGVHANDGCQIRWGRRMPRGCHLRRIDTAESKEVIECRPCRPGPSIPATRCVARVTRPLNSKTWLLAIQAPDRDKISRPTRRAPEATATSAFSSLAALSASPSCRARLRPIAVRSYVGQRRRGLSRAIRSGEQLAAVARRTQVSVRGYGSRAGCLGSPERRAVQPGVAVARSRGRVAGSPAASLPRRTWRGPSHRPCRS